MKQKCALRAYEMIEDDMTIGLGGGATVAFLIDEIRKGNKKIVAVTPSADTEAICIENHIPLLPVEAVSSLDIAFDGCDELDDNLNALKSCGGIHTREKIVASMAEHYVLLADETKLHHKLEFHFPVTLEVVKSARSYVMRQLEGMGAKVAFRHGLGKTGFVIGDDGGYIMEADFSNVISNHTTVGQDMREDGLSVETLVSRLDKMPGIIEHAIFFQIADTAIIAGEKEIRVIRK